MNAYRQIGTLFAALSLVLAALFVITLPGWPSAPMDVEDICAIFEDKGRWYHEAKKSEERWGTPIHVQLAIIRQESTFKFDAKPPRGKLLGIIPWKRPSDAYGYAQALEVTWTRYRNDTGRHSAARDNFGDAIDFVGWYTNRSHAETGISKWDPYNQYLAYHEGHTGWLNKSYRFKPWLNNVARKVDHRAREWGTQLSRCQDELEGGWWIFAASQPTARTNTWV